MARKKIENLDVYDGEITVEMFVVWLYAITSYEARIALSTMQFYYDTKPEDGIRVPNTKSLIVTNEIAKEFLSN